MADVILAEFNGRIWLVGGEAYLNDLLANTLSRGVSIEVVACESKANVHELWEQHCGKKDITGDPWLINPDIVERIRRDSPEHAVFFAQWSAMLDQEAQTVIASAAAWAAEHPDLPLTVAEYLDPDGPQSIADLSRLRAQLVEERLVAAGIAKDRIRRVTRDVAEVPGMGQESQRIDVIVRAD